MTMNTLGLGLGARPVARSRVVGTKSAKAIVGTPVVGKPVQLATRRAAVTVRAGGNPEPIVQAPFVGIKEDLAARGPLYIDDFKQGISPKSLASVFFLFFAALAPAVAFGAVLTSATAGMLGATEVILATAIGGVLYAVLCGQPMSILASTGSVVTYTAILYTTCAQYGLPFFGTYAWIGIWTSILLMIVAVTSSSNLVRFFTKFTDETFAALVACIFCVESAKKIIMMFFNPSISSTLAMGSALTALVTCGSAIAISNFKRSPYGPEGVRNLIGDFAPTFAIAIGCFFGAWLAGNYGFTFDALSLPASLAPSIARPWVTDIMAVPNWVKLAALAPAPACAILLYMDQNITTRLVNASKGLKKPGAYHLDMFWLSLITAVTSICGLPWICASTVHSLTHVKSLTDVKQDPATGREEVTGVTETRWTPLVLNLLIGASIIFLKDILGQIPMCVLSGIFFYLGLAAMRGNEFLERVGMTLITDPAKMPASSPLTKSVSLPTLKKFTIMQIACLAVMWWIKGSPAAMLFPILIAALGPVRIVAGKAGWFTQEELNALDEQVETDPGYVYQAA
ncbi:anion exchanger family [Micromonas commoda]|uniref:Anion exchanger family n=1 Tax=Micromonas commoda (strain RCC299 / NOUM17 / CCMP2709) TaxID=296587 RepID=C1DYA1_MICCC|nr:anion exchanger family [Micromonas commoda]ACO61390.1 anion exchanger family [Micromonas commoda]|eukprot:XP_002500132.1 anion exchanger family [Micromonas commoda]